MTADVVIRGGGIAGSAAALMLARGGFTVLLLEKHREPQHKVCGEFLSPEALPLLEASGLLPAIAAAGARPVRAAAVVGPGGAHCRFALPRAGLALSRFRLDSLLLEAAEQAGVTVARGAMVLRLAFALTTSIGFGSNPSRTCASVVNVRMNSPAPTTSASDSAT